MQVIPKSISEIKPKEIILEKEQAYHKSFAYYTTKRAIAIKVDSKGPVFYCQNRVGKNGKLFRMFKFRSMIVNAEELLEKLRDKNEMSGPMFKINDDPRIT